MEGTFYKDILSKYTVEEQYVKLKAIEERIYGQTEHRQGFLDSVIIANSNNELSTFTNLAYVVYLEDQKKSMEQHKPIYLSFLIFLVPQAQLLGRLSQFLKCANAVAENEENLPLFLSIAYDTYIKDREILRLEADAIIENEQSLVIEDGENPPILFTECGENDQNRKISFLGFIDVITRIMRIILMTRTMLQKRIDQEHENLDLQRWKFEDESLGLEKILFLSSIAEKKNKLQIFLIEVDSALSNGTIGTFLASEYAAVEE